MTPVHEPSTQPISLSLFEKREELRRVLQSRQFAGAPKKSRFLEFVAEQTFLGNGDKLNEYLIGVEVYDRGSDFDPQKDPIVRVQAHEIRRSLRKYYQENLSDSVLRIDLPAGHYVPAFSRSSALGAPDISIPSVTPVVATAGESARHPRRLQVAVTILLAVACIVLAALLALSVRKNRAEPPARAVSTAMPEDLKWFWGPFLPPASPPLIVIPNHPVLRAAHNGDSAQTLAQGHEIAKGSLPEFRDTIHFRELKRFVFVPSLTDFTSVGETLGVVHLCQMFYAAGEPCRVQPSRLVNFEEIRNGNAILLGGSQAWSGRVFLDAQGFQMQGGLIFNRHPGPGELPIYKPEFDSVTNQLTRDYALLLMLPNQDKETRVLLIYGVYTQGSQAAIEYLNNPQQMAEFRKALLAISPDHKLIPRYFEALLTTTVENAVPGNSFLVAVHRIPD